MTQQLIPSRELFKTENDWGATVFLQDFGKSESFYQSRL